MRSLNKSLVFTALSRIIHLVVVFFTFKLLVKNLPQAEVGKYFIFLALSAYFGLVIINPVGTFVHRHLYEWQSKNKLLGSLNWFNVFTILSSIALALFLAFINNFFHLTLPLNSLKSVIVFLMYLVAMNLFNTLLPAINILKYQAFFLIVSPSTHFLALLSAVLLVRNVESIIEIWLLGVAVSHLLGWVIGSIYLYFKMSKSEKVIQVCAPEKENLLSFSTPLIVTNIFFWIISQSYRPITEHVLGLEVLAVAGVGLGFVSTLVVSCEYVLQQVFLPDFYERINTDDLKVRMSSWHSYANRVIPIYISLGLFVSIFSQFLNLTMLTTNQQYSSASYFIAVGVWGEILRATINVFSLIAQSEKRNKMLVFAYMVGACTLLIALYLLHLWGHFEVGLPIVLIVSYLVTVTMVILKVRKNFSIDLNFSKIIKTPLKVLIFLPVILIYPYCDFNLAILVLVTGALLVGFYSLKFLREKA